MAKKKFDWDKFAKGQVAVHMQTIKEARKFNEILHEKGYRWYCSENHVDYRFCDAYEGKLCFHVHTGDLYPSDKKYLLYDRIAYINKCGYEICMFSKYDFGEETAQYELN